MGAGIGRSDKVVGVQGRVRPPAAPLWKVAVPAVRTGRVRQDAARGVAGASVNTDVALAEIRRGRPPRAAVLFAGAGGMTLGLYTAGCEIVAAVEIDPVARLTHEVNFAHRSLFYRSFEDVTRTHPETLTSHLSMFSRSPAGRVDIVAAGPPCQPYSRVGRARLRSVRGGGPAAWLMDPRIRLLRLTVRMIRALRPLCYVLENVPELLRFGGRNLAEGVCESLGDLYESRYFVLQAARYGVPQWRERLFIVGFHRSLEIVPAPPAATHAGLVPRGYLTSSPGRVAAFATGPSRQLVADTPVASRVRPFVTVMEAIGDLPPVSPDGGPRIRMRSVRLPADGHLSDYARLMRTWRGFESTGVVDDHVVRATPRDREIFARMRPGDEYPEAFRLALEIFRERLRDAGNPRPGSRAWLEIRRATVPPYDPETFPNRWWKLVPTSPSRTLTAHLGRDCYSHIHFDGVQARTISVREAARLQSFPDGFRFCGSFNSRMRMIGNAVPPLLALAVASRVVSDLREAAGACRPVEAAL